MKLAADYSGFNFGELLEMDCVSFKTLFRDAFIYKMKQTKEGRDYLEDCWTLTQTSPDREKLREKFTRGEADD